MTSARQPLKKRLNPLHLLPPLVIIIVAIAIYIFVDFAALSDWMRSIGYSYTPEMQFILGDLKLTDRGSLVFKATHPALQTNTAFATNCGEDSDSTSVLGCYANGNIYIKSITDPELSGIQQSTAAHELLHAVWARLPDSERDRLAPELDAIYRADQTVLSARLHSYEESRWHDELHSIIGTENYLDLTPVLADHYAQYFTDRATIVAYYDAYHSTFQSLRAKSESLSAQIDQLRATISANTTEYETGSSRLDADIANFQSRNEAGAFANNPSAFYAEQADLQRRATQLEALYQELTRQILSINSLIEEYNSNAARLNDLTTSISSPPPPPPSA